MENKKNFILRKMLNTDGLVRAVGAHDGLSAKLIGEAKFECVWSSGLEISASHGVPDANILTMTQFLSKANEINQATSIPVIADCDTGFGNVNNVIYMVEQYERCGISGLCIEDKKFPKVNSFIPGRQELADIDEFVGKIKAVKNTQQDKNLLLIARIEALIAGWGMEEALKRGFSYSDAGADAILIHSKNKNPDEIIEFCHEFRKKSNTPLVLVPTTYGDLHEDEIKKLDVKIVIYANHILRSRIKAHREVLNILSKDKKLSSIDKIISPLEEALSLSGLHELKENEKLYDKKKKDKIDVIIPAAGEPTSEIKNEIKDIPISLYNINGSRIIDRAINQLNSIGLKKINLITGYNKEKFKNITANLIENNEYTKNSQLDSVMMGVNEQTESILIIFSDLIFEKDLIERLIANDDDITFLINPLSREDNKTFCDQVVAKKNPVRDGRYLTSHRKNEILKIGKDIFEEKPNYEFTGISFFSNNGLKVLKKSYNECKKNYNKSDFITVMNYIISNNLLKIKAIETSEGWIEIKDKKNLNLAIKFFEE